MILLELKNIKKHYSSRFHGSVRAVDGVSLSVRPGEHCAVVGESGCGKTTLARIIMGLVRPDAGEMLFQGQKVWGDKGRERNFRRMARMVFQDPFSSLDPRYTVRAILDEALHLEGKCPVQQRLELMRQSLTSVRLPPDILHRHPHEFSGGERQRIAIARALMTGPELLILDEAVSSLDVVIQKDVLDCLAALPEEKPLTYIFITHNLKAARRIARRIVAMSAGKVTGDTTDEH
jgi:ABC-type glutathione transport system ATPase component